ncbi:hypothetical protein K9L05_01175 [Candidatus Babeliales bacterium]|nr:hypothetical protein [Candidatus Babeliales bacterium]MCF7899242.1 hypothetical protein [Candidatus Babeliales bacterium]
MENSILLNSGDKFFSIELLYNVENYLTFNVKIKSGKFSGESNFCISEENISLFIKKLSEMHNRLIGNCELRDYDSDSYINFEMIKLGHMLVYGQIGGSHEEQFMRFKFETDQSILLNLINIFKKAILAKFD